jgi:pyruvate,water dikinase
VKNNLPIFAGSMGVIVQRIVSARSAGVAFTMLPNSGDDSRIMLEANWGLAESVVQGTAIPDIYIIKKGPLTLEEKRIAQKLKQVTLKEIGTEEQEIPLEKQSVPCLSEEEAIKISEFALCAESHYGCPQDAEWVVERDRPFPKNVFLVQTRPLTAVQKKSPVDQVADLICNRFLDLR